MKIYIAAPASGRKAVFSSHRIPVVKMKMHLVLKFYWGLCGRSWKNPFKEQTSVKKKLNFFQLQETNLMEKNVLFFNFLQV